MCAVNISPEAGDAPINIMSRRKCPIVSGMKNSKNTFLIGRCKNPVLHYMSTIPSNSIDVVKDNANDQYAVIFQDYPLRRTNNIKYEVDYSGFPCYRYNFILNKIFVCMFQIFFLLLKY